MALYALDEESNLISALDASPFQKLRCLECGAALKKRVGVHRRPHFSHLRSARQCRLYSKSIDHLVLQTRLKEAIGELEMERPFPSILRIADLCWERQKIVFEIQCSLISPSEIERRRKDYAKEGYNLVWLLDDRLYNKKKLRISEKLLRRDAGYFISLKKGHAYDQFELISEGERLFKGPPLPLDLSKPLAAPAATARLQQIKGKKFFFQGDLLFRSLQSRAYLERLLECERSFSAPKPKTAGRRLKAWLQMGMEYLLRKSL